MRTPLIGLLAALCLAGCATRNACVSELPVTSFTLKVPMAEDRASEVTVWQPAAAGTYPLVVFSHGAFAAPERYAELLNHIAAGGYVVAAPLHIDSELIQRDAPPPLDQVWGTRKEDVALLLAPATPLTNLLRQGANISDRRIAAGHSYGGFGAQVMGGARATGETLVPADQWADAILAYSPPGVLPGFIDEQSWDEIARPQLLLTGTTDVLPGFLDDWRDHTAGHTAAKPGDQWLWVGNEVDHYFGRLMGRLDRDAAPARAQFDLALVTTREFLNTYAPSGAVCSQPLATYNNETARLTRR
ncbi:MAG: hypothetical protein AAGA23_16955 [Pseudomonadota bacterium]